MGWFGENRTKLGVGAIGAALLAVGAAGGAGAVHMTRPPIEMAPTTPTAIGKIGATTGVVTVKGRVAEAFGDRFVLDDGTGRTMIDAGGAGGNPIAIGTTLAVQGHYRDGQLRAAYLIDAGGSVTPVGPRGHGNEGGPGERGRHGDRGPDGPPRGPMGPADCAPPPPPAPAPQAG